MAEPATAIESPQPLSLRQLADRVGAVPDFPVLGIIFRDVTTLLTDAEAFRSTVDHMSAAISGLVGDGATLAAIESRGFPFAAAVAYKLGLGLVLIRKPGKLPRSTRSIDYQLEYGTDSLEVHVDDVPTDQRFVVVDDLLATGGTAIAAAGLLRELGARVDDCVFVVDLPDLAGATALADAKLQAHSLISFAGH